MSHGLTEEDKEKLAAILETNKARANHNHDGQERTDDGRFNGWSDD